MRVDKVEEKIPAHKIGLAKMLDQQILILEQGGNLDSVFDKDEQKEIKILGNADYLAYLKRTRQQLGQPDSPSEE